ncbi:MAG: FUSC family protein, partial [Actinomycetales bacterium]
MPSAQSSWWPSVLSSGYLRLAVLTALASVAAYLIAGALPYADPVPAAITALVTMRAAFHHAAKEGLIQTLGALAGAGIALLLVWLVGTGPIVLAVLVLTAFGLARLLRIAAPDQAPFVAMAIAVTMILVVGTHLTTELAIERFMGVVIGAICALGASYLASPAKDTRVLATDLGSLQEDLAALLADVSSGLRADPDPEATREWFGRAGRLRDRSMGIEARLDDLTTHAKWSPRIDTDALSSLRRSADAVRVMSTRMITITSDLLASTSDAAVPAIPPAARSPLADLIAMAADNINSEDPTGQIGTTAASEAVRQADQTAQIALIGGIVADIQRINRASVQESDLDLEQGREQLPDA